MKHKVVAAQHYLNCFMKHFDSNINQFKSATAERRMLVVEYLLALSLKDIFSAVVLNCMRSRNE